jgi:hypothetical protein
MKTAIGIVLAVLLVSFIACRRDEPTNPYPVWIIDLYVYEASFDPTNPLPALRGVPVGVFYIEPSGKDTTVGPMRHTTNRIHLWQHIDSVVTVEYYVRCPHYEDSYPQQVTLYADRAFQGPGRDGPEVIFVDTVMLVPGP